MYIIYGTLPGTDNSCGRCGLFLERPTRGASLAAGPSHCAAHTLGPSPLPLRLAAPCTDMPVTRKLVMLGDCMVGKSNVAIRFARTALIPTRSPTSAPPSSSACAREHAGRCRQGDLRYLGTGPLPRYERHVLYDGGCMIVCFDITDMDTFHSAKSWINELQRRGPRAVIALVGTKCDLRNQRGVCLGDVDEMRSQPIVVAEAGKLQLKRPVACKHCSLRLRTELPPSAPTGSVRHRPDDEGRSASGSFVGRVTGAVNKLVSSPRKAGHGDAVASASASATSVAASETLVARQTMVAQR